MGCTGELAGTSRLLLVGRFSNVDEFGSEEVPCSSASSSELACLGAPSCVCLLDPRVAEADPLG